MNRHTLILAVSVLFVLFAACRVDDSFASKKTLYQEVIKRVEKGEIKTEEEKSIKIPEGSIQPPCSAQLPPDLENASVGNGIYISRPSTNQLLVVFKTWQGKGSNMEGYLYATKPLSSTETRKDYYGDSVIVVGRMELVLEKKLNINWYRVSHRLD